MHKYQTFWKRVLAGLIDAILFFPFVFPDIFFDLSSPKNFLMLEIASVLLWTSNSVIGNGIYGNTIGKKMLGLKVLNLQENSTIGLLRGFFRESIWFFVSLAMVVGFAIQIDFQKPISYTDRVYYDDLFAILSILWLIAELITMLANNKKRAIHDYLANSVVVNVSNDTA